MMNKSIAILGGSTGIGAATIRRLAAAGNNIFLGDINVSASESLAEEIRASGGSMEHRHVDQGDPQNVSEMFAEIRRDHGGIDGLFLNGADTSPVMQDEDSDAVDIDVDLWDRAMRTNAKGYMLGAKYGIPALLDKGGGPIVCTSSELAFAINGTLLAYGASKSAINLLVKHTAVKFGKQGIRCNAVAPALVMTEAAKHRVPPEIEAQYLSMTPHTRLCQPEDVAALVAFLLSDDAEFINGQIISINGGTTLR
jgi:NAD(P)-dependent dehydrogenase (short-subunit alcohol dehydrogenase family)